MALDVKRAHTLLDNVESTDEAIAIERARLAIYEGDYDGASAIAARPEVARTDAGAELLAIATGCARATAGALTETDVARGVTIRLQDESDRPLAPFLIDVAVAAREAMARDLKVELPRPLRIELVRDLFTLAAMTGLPESAAQTTGTVAVAKWGRVTMISPRASHTGTPGPTPSPTRWPISPRRKPRATARPFGCKRGSPSAKRPAGARGGHSTISRGRCGGGDGSRQRAGASHRQIGGLDRHAPHRRTSHGGFCRGLQFCPVLGEIYR